VTSFDPVVGDEKLGGSVTQIGLATIDLGATPQDDRLITIFD